MDFLLKTNSSIDLKLNVQNWQGWARDSRDSRG